MGQLSNTDVWICKAISKPNTYYVLRNSGEEIEVNIDKGVIKAAWPLFQFEIDFINKYYNT